jgi:type IV pilus assembly protein PilC
MKFSESLKVLPQFSDYEYYSIRIGEESGTLIKVLKGLSSFYSQKVNQKRTVIGALTYPGVILVTALLAITFMLVYMVPLFEDVFKRIGGDLPWLTQIILNVSESFSTYFSGFLILIGILFSTHLIYKKREWYMALYFFVLLRIPIVGNLIIESNILRASQSLGLLLESRVPLTEALSLTRKMLVFYPIQQALRSVEKQIYQGRSLHEGMSDHSIFSARLVSLIKVGEESNQLAMILNKFALQKETELQHKAKILGNVIEPLIIVFLGFFVAVILIAMYLPMFQLSTSMGF